MGIRQLEQVIPFFHWLPEVQLTIKNNQFTARKYIPNFTNLQANQRTEGVGNNFEFIVRREQVQDILKI